MVRQKTSEQKAKNIADESMQQGTATIVTLDDGTKIVIPLVAPGMGRARFTDLTKPQRDQDGDVPEFACVSYKRQQIAVQGQPNDTFIVEPFEVLRGEQWRHLAEPAKAWGDFPPFWERPKDRDGEPEAGRYVLTEEQAIKLVSLVKNPHYGWKSPRSTLDGVLDLMEKRGKLMRYDEKTGARVDDPEELYEDRPKVLAAVGKKKRELQAEHQRRMKIMTEGRAR